MIILCDNNINNNDKLWRDNEYDGKIIIIMITYAICDEYTYTYNDKF